MERTQNKSTDKPKTDQELKGELEKALEEDDRDLARAIQRSRAELLIAERKARTAQIQSGKADDRAEGRVAKRGEKSDEDLVGVIQGLLERGLDVKIVGQMVPYLMGNGSNPFPMLPGASLGTQQGLNLTVQDLKTFFDMGKESKSGMDPSMQQILDKLADKVNNLETRITAGSKQQGYIIVQPDGTMQEVEPGKPIILKQSPPVSSGEDIEIVREHNRHAEEMEKIKIESDYKQSVAGTLASVPESLAAGLANAGMNKPPQTGQRSNQTPAQFKECTDCHFMIPIPANNPSVIICPKCGVKYEGLPEENAS